MSEKQSKIQIWSIARNISFKKIKYPLSFKLKLEVELGDFYSFPCH